VLGEVPGKRATSPRSGDRMEYEGFDRQGIESDYFLNAQSFAAKKLIKSPATEPQATAISSVFGSTFTSILLAIPLLQTGLAPRLPTALLCGDHVVRRHPVGVWHRT
jgi:hypothetical protein